MADADRARGPSPQGLGLEKLALDGRAPERPGSKGLGLDGLGLDGLGVGELAAAARAEGVRGLPPVERWNPPYCGEIDMRIRRDGTWLYAGTPIGRPALARLFSTILRKDEDRHVLVTPVERVGIVVEDAPFLAVEMRIEEGAGGRTLAFRTNLDDWTRAGGERPLRFDEGEAGGLKPYVLVRGNLWALVTRALTFDLLDLVETRVVAGAPRLGIASADAFFPLPGEEGA